MLVDIVFCYILMLGWDSVFLGCVYVILCKLYLFFWSLWMLVSGVNKLFV